MILDSTFLIDVLRGSSDVADLIEDVDTTGTPFVSAVTVMELSEGIHLADATDDERSSVRQLLTDVNELPFDRECAIRAGRINADLVSSGEPIDETDVMVAATALVHDYPVVTRNVDHFERIDGLTVRSY
ncbi:type II toxin-antitoxin system VapC family toxin [Halobiforma nitratireducens]|uniref:Ribonuclease VapC n=1 Tax=Halobiforma nitratireducens JCM 10879 TaxID=1227454 RepID=M0LZG1_9EURY|nr:type II toxin-antitoxin system VapC family toxin [Halobiforma nitratireducens]EMA38533.1 PilT protein domain-containing protein [Halobiforma nitratireducens JCM 10879]